MEHDFTLKNHTPKLGEGGSLPPRRLRPELPQGLTASLALSPEAAACFEGLSDQDKGRVVAYIQSTDTGEEAKARVRRAVEGLAGGDLGFLAACGGGS